VTRAPLIGPGGRPVDALGRRVWRFARWPGLAKVNAPEDCPHAACSEPCGPADCTCKTEYDSNLLLRAAQLRADIAPAAAPLPPAPLALDVAP
jgi:hypothetical protein